MIKAIKQMGNEARHGIWVCRWEIVIISGILGLLYGVASWTLTDTPEQIATRKKKGQQYAESIARGEYEIKDICVYQSAMLACLERLPKGADRLTASGNDWDEVATVCKDFASKAAYRMAKNVKEGCK